MPVLFVRFIYRLQQKIIWLQISRHLSMYAESCMLVVMSFETIPYTPARCEEQTLPDMSS